MKYAKMDPRGYAILILAFMVMALGFNLLAQRNRDNDENQVYAGLTGSADQASATRQVAEATRQVAESNRMIAEALNGLSNSVAEVGAAIRTLKEDDASYAQPQAQEEFVNLLGGREATPTPRPTPESDPTPAPREDTGVFQLQ